MTAPGGTSDLQAVVTLATQVEEAIRTGREPLLWTPTFVTARRLTVVALRTHGVMAPRSAAAREAFSTWSRRRLARLILGTQIWLFNRLALFLLVPKAVEWWCRTKGRPAHAFWRGWELGHIAYVAMTEPAFPRAARLVGEYAIRVVVHGDAWQAALPRFSPVGAAIVDLTSSRPELQERGVASLLRYMSRDAKMVDPLPASWAGWDQKPAGRAGGTDAESERVLSLFEVLPDIGTLSLTDAMARALDGEDDYLPNAAALDFLNRLEVYRDREKLAPEESFPRDEEGRSAEDERGSPEAAAERIRRAKVDGGLDPKVWTPEAAREASGGLPALAALRGFCAAPPLEFAEILTDQEDKAFQALRAGVLSGTLPPRTVLGHIARTAGVSAATVSRLIKKIRAHLQ